MSVVMDIDAFWNRVGEDGDLAHELIALFFADSPKRFDDVRVAVLGKDASALRHAAHAIKGAVANFSAGPAVEAAGVLEEMGRIGNLSGVDEACIILDRQLVLLRSALTKFDEGVSV